MLCQKWRNKQATTTSSTSIPEAVMPTYSMCSSHNLESIDKLRGVSRNEQKSMEYFHGNMII